MKFDEALPRLVHAYEHGVLVPFIGSGMSVPVCPSWKSMIDGIVAEMHSSSPKLGKHPDPALLTQVANDLVRRLKLEGPEALPKVLSKVLYRSHGETGHEVEIPNQTRKLARVWWPLVLTTNYDDLLTQAADLEKKGHLICGRSQLDCQTVLNSLTGPSSPILWALQGYLSRDYPDKILPDGNKKFHDLAQQLVVGHEHYRRVTYREPHFRRAFADVFRNRTLLFLGSGLQEPYLVDLFGEILEFFGASPHCHYALLKRDGKKPINTEFLRTALNVIVIEYNEHGELPGLLDQFRESLEADRTHQTVWAFSIRAPSRIGHDDLTDLKIIRGVLPLPSGNSECVAVSAGLSNESQPRPVPGSGMAALHSAAVKQDLLCEDARPEQAGKTGLVWRYPNAPIFCVTARTGQDVKDLRSISKAVYALCDVASEASYNHIHVQLLAAGSGGAARPYTPLYSLIESVRGFARWRQEKPDKDLRLSFYLVAVDVLFNLATGRVDVGELLSQKDLRFWVETVYPGRLSAGEIGSWVVERRLEFADGAESIRELARRYAVPKEWTVRLFPQPVPGPHALAVQDVPETEGIEAFGVVPGCTLRFLPTLS